VVEKEQTEWKRMIFKKNKVWLATGQNGKPILKSGKVLIKYQIDQDYEYWVHENGIKPVGSLKAENKGLKKNRAGTKTERKGEFDKETLSDNTIFIYTDGASSGNPGPSGIGILLRFKDHEKEIPVRVFTDSSYACGVLTLGWKARKNKELINSIKKLISKFSNLKLIKVKGHNGFAGNEKADFLATSAIRNEKKI
jgi:ribonuclease HI